MEDKALDDFFAKKDKKKKVKKSKPKFTTTDDIAKKLQEGQKNKAQEKEKPPPAAPAPIVQETELTPEERELALPKEIDDSEWKEYDESAEKDYSGLRIQSLQIGASGEGEEEGDLPDEYDEEGELIIRPKDGASGPWKKLDAAASAAAPAASTEPPPPVESKVTGGVYRPPGARMASQQPQQTRRGKKQAPDVHSEQQFPSLHASLEKPPSDASDKYFEKVTRGGRASADDVPGSRGPKLDLENKYAALSK
ncbi:protein CDV3 homolog [Glandiceps talaboti]